MFFVCGSSVPRVGREAVVMIGYEVWIGHWLGIWGVDGL